MNRAERRAAGLRMRIVPRWFSAEGLPDVCEVCEGPILAGEVCRELFDNRGVSIYGHAPCVDQLVRERQALGQLYLGDIDLGAG